VVAVNPPILPVILPQLPMRNVLRSLGFLSVLGGWEDKPYTPAPTHTRHARVRVYVSILPYSQKDRVYKGFKVVGSVVFREFGVGAGRIA